ncbi:MAG: phytanoyl-CoA dioxygenase family protein [Alphaproteobacteria bacterium]
MLSDGQRQSFDDDGYLVIPRVFHVDELAWLGGEVRSVVHGYATRPRPSVWSSDEAPAGTFIDVHRREEAFRRLAAHPRLHTLASDVAHGPVRLLRTRLYPGARFGDLIWRRDSEIWRRTGLLDGASALTAAVVLDGPHAAATALHVLPRSHRSENGGVKPPVRLSASLGSVILLHCATRYALRQPGDAARAAFLVTYDEAVETKETREQCQGTPPYSADASLWPVPIWIAG